MHYKQNLQKQMSYQMIILLWRSPSYKEEATYSLDFFDVL